MSIISYYVGHIEIEPKKIDIIVHGWQKIILNQNLNNSTNKSAK